MNTKYVLVDHENVQPKDLALLDGVALHVIVFLGANQARISTELATALQARGANGRYVRVTGNGNNALDFHIAFYLGELCAADPAASFHVIAKDGDYDPLLDHLRSRGISAQRSATLAALLPVADERVEQAIAFLRNPNTNRPGTVKKLGNALNTHLGGKLKPMEVEQLITQLVRQHVITVTDSKVTYT